MCTPAAAHSSSLEAFSGGRDEHRHWRHVGGVGGEWASGTYGPPEPDNALVSWSVAATSLGFVHRELFFFFPLLIYTFFYALVSTVLQEVVFREESEKNGLGVAPRSCFGVQGGCFLSSLSEGKHPFHPLIPTLLQSKQMATYTSSLCANYGMLSFILHVIFSQ